MANKATECPAHGRLNGFPQLEANKEIIDQSKLLPIPSPPYKRYFGLLGHLTDLDPVLPVRSYWKLMDEYAPIFKMDLGQKLPRVFVGSRELVNEMADDNRFTKFTHRLHQEMRAVFGDGLFSAESTDKAWWKAHRLLVPALGPVGLSKMFNDMQDIAAQLVLKWDRFGPEHEIAVIDDMSRLTFDTIGLCAYGYRFNQFYNEAPHPFEKQLKESIVESGRRANRPDLLNRFYYYKDEEHRQQNIVKMRELCKKIIQDRLDNPKPDAKDLLNVMIHGVDHESGETLGFDNVIYQIPTLLGGGYETTSATLCFIFYFLSSNPEALHKAQQEVDDIVGKNVLTHDMLRNLKYLDATMKETLRMQHPVSLLTRFATRDTVLGGKYFVKKGQMVSGIWRHFHRDPKVWGEDADMFRPERMLDAEFQKMPPNSWKPFGDGLRACIGRGFAEQEILIAMSMILQRFEIEKVDPNYELQLTGQMGVKPVDFKIRVRRREGRTWTTGIPGSVAAQNSENTSLQSSYIQERRQPRSNGTRLVPTVQRPVSVLWGGNQGTCKSMVQSFVEMSSDFGLDVVEILELDSAVDKLPTGHPSIIITPSYEGRPPYNAKRFVDWIERLAVEGQKLSSGVKYAIFGAGNSDWVHTFHRIPKLIDERLQQIGAERIFEPGFANVKRDTIGPWESWSESLCLSLTGINQLDVPTRVGVDVRIESKRPLATPPGVEEEQLTTGLILANSQLADSSTGLAKRHVEVQLPQGVEYRSGDYLHVQGRNADETVFRVIDRFRLNPEDLMTVQSSKKYYHPTEPIAVEHFLRNRVELATPITKKQVGILASWADDGTAEFNELKRMYTEETYQDLLDRKFSILDVLEEIPKLYLPFGVYIDLLPALVPRAYSISSSPLAPESGCKNGLIASLTFDVFEAPALSGHGTFRGITSPYLGSRNVGSTIQCLVRPNRVPFQLPANLQTPIIMLATGSGIAPMRAFIQERAALRQVGKDNDSLGPALLFFGCRHPEKDYLYRSELESWQNQGLVETIPCFSKPDDINNSRYVTDALWEQRERVWELFEKGAHVYVCGNAGRIGRSSAETWRRIWMERTQEDESRALEWFEKIKNVQYISDVY